MHFGYGDEKMRSESAFVTSDRPIGFVPPNKHLQPAGRWRMMARG
jgi:hypothetical protein